MSLDGGTASEANYAQDCKPEGESRQANNRSNGLGRKQIDTGCQADRFTGKRALASRLACGTSEWVAVL